MTDYLKQTLKTDLCLSFAESFSANSKDNYFLFLGRPTAWVEPYDDNNPPPIEDTLEQDLEAWRNMIALAKINKSNVLVGAARYNWEYSKIFDQFDHTIDLYQEGNERQFYCITDDLNVYKCISNNYGTGSTIKPTAVTPEEQITQDGYVWKFMFKVREELYEFLTDEFIPIEKLENILYSDERSLQNNVRIGSIPSAIGNAILTQFGGSYPLAITKDYSTESKHIITEVIDVDEFKVFPSDDLDKTNDIYNDYYELYIAEGTGAGYKSVIIDYTYEPSENSITIVTEDALPVSTDSIYRIYPRIKISGDGTGASVIPTMNDEKIIVGFTILNGGKNYHYATMDVYRKNPTYSNKTLGRLLLSPLNGHGFDAIKELGSNMVMVYVPLRNAEKILDPDAKNILANDYRQVGLIKNTYYNDTNDLVPVSSAEDYKTYIDIENINSKSVIHLVTSDDVETLLPVGSTLKQGSESNAYQARGTVDSVETDSDSYVITVTNTNGRFLASTSTTYPLVKEGETDLEFSGSITGVIVNNLYDQNTFTVNSFVIGTSTASTAKITVWECDPYGLSGRIYFTDLKGKFRNSYYAKDTNGTIVLVRGERIVGYESINVSTGQLEGISPSTVGIIKSVGTIESETKQFYKVTTTLHLTPSVGTFASDLFSPDDVIVTNSGTEATVISYTMTSSTVATLEVTGLTAAFAVSDVLTITNNGTETATNAVVSSIDLPEILPYYGDVIYIQNVTPIVASNDSEEHIKVIIKF